VAEGHEAPVADQQVERAGEKREAHHLHQEDRIGDEGATRKNASITRKRGALVREAVRARTAGSGGTAPRLEDLIAACRKSPAGLIMSTIAMMMKITVFEASGDRTPW